MANKQGDETLPKSGDTLGPGTSANSTLVEISGILKDGFKDVTDKLLTVNKNVCMVNSNMDSLNKNMNFRFKKVMDKFDENVDCESQVSEMESVARSSPVRERARKRPHDYSESEGEIFSSDEEQPPPKKRGLLTQLAKDLLLDESVGDPVGEEVADYIKAAFKRDIQYEELKKRCKDFPRPSNLEEFSTPKINEVIWGKLPQSVRDRDRGWQNNHITFMSIMSGVSRVVEILGDQDPEVPWIKDCVTGLAGAITLSSALSKNWHKSRREDLKTALPPDFKRLASKDVPPSPEWLFGNDLEGSIKIVEGQNRLAKKMEVKKSKPATSESQSDTYKKSRRGGKRFNNFKKKDNKQNYKNRRDDRDDHDDRKDSRKDFQKKGTSRY